MSEKKLPIKFQLIHIEDNQFSTFEEMLDVEKPIKQEIGFGYGVDVENSAVAVSMEFVLHKGEKPLLKQKIQSIIIYHKKTFITIRNFRFC